MAGARSQHLRDHFLRDVEEACEIDRDHRCEIGLGIVNEGLWDEDPGVVDQRVNSPKMIDGRADNTLGSLGSGDVTIDEEDIRIAGHAGLADRARIGDDAVADLAKPLH